MNINTDKLRDVFSYHPPDQERAKKHAEWNELVVNFVLEASKYIESPSDYIAFLRKAQEVRMLGNQTITNKAIGLNYQDIFIGEELQRKSAPDFPEATPRESRTL
jgi:hypothetical protein